MGAATLQSPGGVAVYGLEDEIVADNSTPQQLLGTF